MTSNLPPTEPPDYSEGRRTAHDLGEIFGEPISVYTREQALEDGVLVDARLGAFAEVTRQHFNKPLPVNMTAALFSLIRQAVENPRWANDYAGIWHDVLVMARFAFGRAVTTGRGTFQVIIRGVGRKSLHTLAACWDGEGWTFMLAEED